MPGPYSRPSLRLFACPLKSGDPTARTQEEGYFACGAQELHKVLQVTAWPWGEGYFALVARKSCEERLRATARPRGGCYFALLARGRCNNDYKLVGPLHASTCELHVQLECVRHVARSAAGDRGSKTLTG
eukprot:1578963-Alexandrium_andersonii.AAC.1